MIRVLDRVFMPEAPAERLAVLRILVGLYGCIYLPIRITHLWSYAGVDPYQFQPVGVVTVLPRPLLPAVVVTLVVLAVLFSFPFLLGFRYRITAPIYAALLLWVLTYSNSFGQILHVDNLFCLHVIALALCPAADAYSLDARRRRAAGAPPPEPSGRYGWGIRLMCVLCVFGYFLAAVAKAKNGGLEFVSAENLRNYVAYDTVRKLELGSITSPVGEALLPFPLVFAGLAYLSLALEWGAPLALFHRKLGIAWAVLIWGFHLGVLVLMAISFTYPLTMVAFAAFFRVEKLADWKAVRWLTRKLRRDKAADPPIEGLEEPSRG
ncbi:MAG: HTTM domain-containing protein [Myxococcota bacterium]